MFPPEKSMHPRFNTLKKHRAQSVSKAVDQMVEKLEQRQFLTVTTVANQWTAFSDNAASGGQKIYVSSSSGNNSFSGLDADHPKATIAAAKSLLRDGHPDWLLLKRGDTFNEAIGTISNKSGVSHDDPIVIGSYGIYEDPFNGPTYYDFSTFPEDPQGLNLDPRPIVNSGTSDGISLIGNSSHVDIVGIQFFANTYNGGNSNSVAGVRVQLTGTDYLVEDVLVKAYKDNFAIGNPTTPVNGFILRRSQSLDAYNTMNRDTVHAQGLYASGSTQNLTIEENVFDHAGWRAAKRVDGTNISDGQEHPEDKTVFNHDMYINTGAVGTLVQGNATSGTFIFEIMQEDVIRVRVYVPQDAGFGVAPGIDAMVRVPEIPDREFRRKSPSVSVPAEAIIFNRDGMQVAVVNNGGQSFAK